MIIDATDLRLGRMATVVAKQALLGETIDIVNCENAVLTGNRDNVLGEYKNRLNRITYKGPIVRRMPDRFVKRTIRGMLPYKQYKGDKAFKRIKCYMGVPNQFKDKKFETIKEANIANVPSLRYVYVKEICKEIGAKI